MQKIYNWLYYINNERKKKIQRAPLIVNKIDAISDYYSNNVKNNPDT